MGVFSSICCMFWRLSLRFRRVQPGKILLVVQKRCMQLRLFFVDRQRQMENVACDIIHLTPQKVILKSSKRFLPDILRGERCSLYVKIPHYITERHIGVANPAVRHGFLFKSKILANHLDPVSKECIIEMSMPHSYVQRDLQRHERVNPTPLMISEVSLWICGRKLPNSPSDLREPAFCYRDGDPTPSVQLINLSAGGVRLQLNNLSCFENPQKELNRPIVISLVLYKPMRKKLAVWASCSCIKMHFSPQLKILTLFLKYMLVWNGSDEAGGCWQSLGREGLPAIEDWVDNDYCMLLDKRRMVSEELSRCFGLEAGKGCRKSVCCRKN